MGNGFSLLSVSFFLEGISIVFFILVLVLSFILYFFKKRPIAQCKLLKKINYKSLIIAVISFRLFFVIFKTIGQYYVWAQNEFTQFLLPPHQSINYFIFYSWGHFWMNVFLVVGVAAAFYLLLRGLRRYQKRFFEEGETELGFLTALVVGWPAVVIFVPMIFTLAIFSVAFRHFVFKENLTPLGGVFLITAAIIMLWGSQLIKILNLGALGI